MTSPDFSETDGPMDMESFGEILSRWAALPYMTKLSPEQSQRAEALLHPEGELDRFSKEQSDAINELVQSGRHFDALRALDVNQSGIEHQFQGDAIISASIMTYRKRGYVQEHLATYGDYSKLELTDPVRRMMFRAAAASYMKANLELGCRTASFMRVAESCFGAGLSDVGNAIMEEVFGPNLVIIGVNDTGANVALQDLLRRATDVKTVGPVTLMSVTIPDPSLN